MLSEHVFWLTSRAAGVAALLFSSLAVAIGLGMGSRFARTRKADLRVAHEALSLATLVALGVHAVALLFDSYLHPSLAAIAIPFASAYERWWMAAGIAGGWILLILGVSAYARTRIGQERWRKLHRFTALGWALGLAHAIGQGTDARTWWFLLAVGAAAIPAAALLAARLAPTLPDPEPRSA
jgi:predicted ferric reductase